jgi:hypothetical protein
MVTRDVLDEFSAKRYWILRGGLSDAWLNEGVRDHEILSNSGNELL